MALGCPVWTLPAKRGCHRTLQHKPLCCFLPPFVCAHAGLYLAVRGDLGAPRAQYRVYCSMHSEPQRRKDQCAEVPLSSRSMNKACVFLMSFLQVSSSFICISCPTPHLSRLHCVLYPSQSPTSPVHLATGHAQHSLEKLHALHASGTSHCLVCPRRNAL